MTPSVLLIGLGLHARRVHFPVLGELAAAGKVRFAGIVDRHVAAAGVRAHAEGGGVPTAFVDDLAADGELTRETVATLDALVQRAAVSAVLVATEPLAHGPYARWALSRGLDVLVDKPPTARTGLTDDPGQARGMVADFGALATLARERGRRAGVLTQRRCHDGYLLLRELVREVRERTGCPPTSVHVEHSDGEWRMPWEVVRQEYHPFNRGYGVLLHSGYHAVDIGLWLTDVTEPERGGYTAMSVRPHFTVLDDVRAALPDERIHALLGGPPPAARVESRGGLGEIDAHLTIGLQRDGATPTVLTVAALHTSFSRRGWLDSTGRNLYTGNGRRVHESVSLQQGPFQAIRLHSYKARLPGEDGAGGTQVGGDRHWLLQVFRNTSAFPDWRTVREYTSEDVPGGPEAAKRRLVGEFLGTGPFGSELAGHVVTVAAIGSAYESWSTRGSAGPPAIITKLEDP
ncbi:Gfo/Idh/MocA family oxidoreductase [Dactylosporangium salmoneum]|uniref:Gfo/Idh/MocA-like oxidoreductase N-terminal domain-containing protein n=1 Tax=Dactylosporangium salmoneum TaxID=53361 RepID=A0ABN3FY16_9ACTN